jgi:hypothetical protein
MVFLILFRDCTPHFHNQSQDCKSTSLKQDRDLAEQQLKVLRLGNNQFSVNEFNKSVNNDDVILEPGDVLYHPAGI